jgi:hypothetical protein
MLEPGYRRCRPAPAWLLAAAICVAMPGSGAAQSACSLVPDEHHPSEKVLRCGDGLTIRSAVGTRYKLIGQRGDGPPTGAQLDVGALFIEFKPTERRRDFQILTPYAIAAVRGTTWAVEVGNDMTSTLVVLGFVEVKRPGAAEGSLLRAGQGADVTAGSAPIVVKRWAKPRVDALLARFSG